MTDGASPTATLLDDNVMDDLDPLAEHPVPYHPPPPPPVVPLTPGQLTTAVNTLVSTQHDLQNTLGHFIQHVEHATSTPPALTGRAPIPRGHDPQVFDGKSVHVLPFLQEIRAAVHLQRNALPTSEDKSLFLMSFLGPGAPQEWWNVTTKQDLTIVH